MFKSVIAYRIAPTWEQTDLAVIESALEAMPFIPCQPTQRDAQGWIAPRGEDGAPLIEAIGGHYIMKLCLQTRKLPASAVKEALAERMAKILAETGRKPRGQAKKDLKEEIELEMLPRAFTKTSATMVWLDPKARLLCVSSGSQGGADRVTTALIETLSDATFKLSLVRTATSAAAAMSRWLSEREGPASFSIDRECVLQQPDEGKASVRYSRHPLDTDEVVTHIEQGKVPTQLAMTWNDRVSFVLTDMMQLKRITVLDVAIEDGKGGGEGADSGFDTDVAIMTGELSGLIPALLEALDGEVYGDVSEPKVTTEPAAASEEATEESAEA